jgi:hypothetical protein
MHTFNDGLIATTSAQDAITKDAKHVGYNTAQEYQYAQEHGFVEHNERGIFQKVGGELRRIKKK